MMIIILLHFTGPPVPITARVYSTPRNDIPLPIISLRFTGPSVPNNGKGALNTPGRYTPADNITSFYGSSCANSGYTPADIGVMLVGFWPGRQVLRPAEGHMGRQCRATGGSNRA
eukprot:1187991-Prorocentrum_minimum.AAC.1